MADPVARRLPRGRHALSREQVETDQRVRILLALAETIALEHGYARLFLIEVHAAGPQAIARRHEVQARIVEELASVFGARSEAARFACQVIVSSVSALLVAPLVGEDAEAVLAMGPPMRDHIRRLHEAGLFTI